MDSLERLSLQGRNARVLVAVDFGTTFSGFAYARFDSPEAVHKLHEWDGAMEASAVAYCKTQTSLYYVKQPDGGRLELKEWGWPAFVSFNADCKRQARAKKLGGRSRELAMDHPEGHFVTRFKLHLAGAANIASSRAGGLSADDLPDGLTVERAITDYLRGISAFIIKILQRKYGPQLTAKEVQWCLTVPSIWDDIPKQKMKVYAEMAGTVEGRYTPRGVQASPHKLIICLEPEAASFHCLHVSRNLKLRKGDQYLIADIGGGTVDIVVHEKASADGLELEVKEVVASYGGLCGGTYVDQNFTKFLSSTVGCFEAYAADKTALRMDVQRIWELGKRSYTGQPNSQLLLSFPAGLATAWEEFEQQAGMEARESYDELELSNEDMKKIFDPVVNEIIGLITRKLTSKIKAIMVVGGFSSSPYLMDRIEQAFSSRVKKIINPPEAGGEICHGAVLMSLAPDAGIVSRIARKTYGLKVSRLVEEGDPAHMRFFDDDGMERCYVFKVYTNKGSELPAHHKVSKEFYPVSSGQKWITFEIYSSSLLTCPRYTTDDGVVLEGTFRMDLSGDLHKGKKRAIEVTMFFGKSVIEVQGRRTNFGDTEKIETFWFEMKG